LRQWLKPGLRNVLVCLGTLSVSLGLAAQMKSEPPTGLWDGTVQGKAGEVNFGIDLQRQGDTIHAVLLNASDHQPFSSAAWSGETLTLHLDYYDGTLTAHMVSPQRMEGEYSRQSSKGVVHIPLTLVPHREPAPGKPWTGATLDGDWLIHPADAEGAEKNTLVSFQQQLTAMVDGKVAVTGILDYVSGDTGLLHGAMFQGTDGQAHFHLSRFDGIHVLALDGEFQPDGSLKGHLGGFVSLATFTAERSKDIASADPNVLAEGLTKVKDPQEAFPFSGLDEAGKTVDQNNAEFKGKPIIIDIFGTWCPNCHDEAPVLEKLYRNYHDQGLEIVGLAYEYTDDMARNLRQIGIYRSKFGLTYPLLLSGTTAEGQIAKTLPQLVNFGAFPTSIFIDRSGHVRAILAGFSGPSTGDKYKQVQERMDELAREIVGGAN
jgi:thiol-disulfide isomerase/thioredoxin